MALKPADKPMLPLAAPAGHIQCAADSACRKPGRLWVDGYETRERLCVEHYYAWLEQHQTDTAA